MTTNEDAAYNESSGGPDSVHGADRYEDLNSRFQKKFAELKKEKEEIAAEKQQLEDQLNQLQGKKIRTTELVQDLLDRRERIFTYAVDKGYDPKTAMQILALDDITDEKKIDLLMEKEKGVRQQVTQEFAKKHGRNPRDVNLGTYTLDWSSILEMPDHRIDKLPTETLQRAQEKELKKQQVTKGDRLRRHK